MASYQVRQQRDPLVDQNTALMLERRGRELLGVGMIVLAMIFAALLGSYSANDPGWMVASDAPVANWMGRIGAAIASTLFIIGGLGVWGIPAILGLWGLRFVTHIGEDRALGRVVFAVIAVALGSVFAATHVPGPGWPHPAIGLGGLFGDTLLGALLALMPMSAGLGLKLLSVGFGVALLAMGLFVTGFDMAELRRIGRFLAIGSTMVYASLLTLAGKSANGTLRVASALQEKNRARREMAASASPDLIRSAPSALPDMQPAPLRAGKSVGISYARPNAAQAAGMLRPEPRLTATEPVIEPAEPARERGGLLSRMPHFIRRATALAEAADYTPAPQVGSEDRIKARINDVIRSRVRQSPPTPQSSVQAVIARREPPLNRRGPQPPIAVPRGAGLTLPMQPPLTSQMTTPAAALAPVAVQPRVSVDQAWQA